MTGVFAVPSEVWQLVLKSDLLDRNGLCFWRVRGGFVRGLIWRLGLWNWRLSGMVRQSM